MPTPYSDQLAGRDAVLVLRESLDAYRSLPGRLTPALFDTPWTPGKWTLGQILVHVAQWEMIFGVRVRCALGMPGYTIQPLDQDPILAADDPAVSGDLALRGFLAIREMNVAMASALSRAQRDRPCQHPERGTMTVDDLLQTLAGHPVHHYKQIDAAVRAAG